MLKVKAHGIQGDAARWIQNWLAGRRQRVFINQSSSNYWTPVTSGVPQGIVLDPLLLYMYICKWSRSQYCQQNVYICRWYQSLSLSKNPDDKTELQEDINKLVELVNKWQMHFNVDKCLWCTSDQTTFKATIPCPINSCQQQIESGMEESSSQNFTSGKNKQRKAAKRPTE